MAIRDGDLLFVRKYDERWGYMCAVQEQTDFWCADEWTRLRYDTQPQALAAAIEHLNSHDPVTGVRIVTVDDLVNA